MEIKSSPYRRHNMANIFIRAKLYQFSCTLFCYVVLKQFTIGQHERHLEQPKQQFFWPSGGFVTDKLLVAEAMKNKLQAQRGVGASK